MRGVLGLSTISTTTISPSTRRAVGRAEDVAVGMAGYTETAVAALYVGVVVGQGVAAPVG
jgi:hypothetical protein